MKEQATYCAVAILIFLDWPLLLSPIIQGFIEVIPFIPARCYTFYTFYTGFIEVIPYIPAICYTGKILSKLHSSELLFAYMFQHEMIWQINSSMFSEK